MGNGIELAKQVADDDQKKLIELLDNMKDQLIIVLIKRCIGLNSDILEIPISEIDDTGGLLLGFGVDHVNKKLLFKITDKH